VDAIDAALVAFRPDSIELLGTHNEPYPVPLKTRLHDLATAQNGRLDELFQTDVQVGECFAKAALRVLESAGMPARRVAAIGSHGQTIRHAPSSPIPYTVQLGDPNVIAERTGITTIADFRRRDVAAGGEGAPLTPPFHVALLSGRHPNATRAIVNIGGIANATIVPARAGQSHTVIGFDTGPGNCLLDAWARENLGREYDASGGWAARGRPDERLLSRMLSDPFFDRPPPRSTGRETFNLAWLDARIRDAGANRTPEDIQRTLCELTARAVTTAIEQYAAETIELFLCGGGVHNAVLVERLQALLAPRPVKSTDALGLHPDWVEAVAFAWLAKRTLERCPGNLPSVTGAAHPVVLGGIYPGTRATGARLASSRIQE